MDKVLFKLYLCK